MAPNGSDGEDDDLPKKPLSRAGVVAWSLVLFVGVRMLDILLDAQATASAVGQAVLVEWGATRLGVAWSEPARGEPPVAEVAKRALTGTSVGFVLAFLVVAALRIAGGTIESVPNAAVPVLVIGFITAALHAWRDELLLHGLVLRATAGGATDVARVLACGLTSAGAALGRTGATAADVVVAALLGVVFGALWIRDRGAWLPVGAHAALRFTADTLVMGGIVQLRLSGEAGVLGRFTAAAALAPVAAAAIVMTLRGMSPAPARVG